MPLITQCNYISCTFQGGLKAVVVTDAFQMIVIYAGIIALIVFGSSAVGGMSQVWAIAKESERLTFNR